MWMTMITHIDKKVVLLIVLFFFLISYTLNGNKFFTLSENSLETSNMDIMESNGIKHSHLIEMKDINNNRIYVYNINEEEHYVFIYSKSILFNLFHLDDKFKIKDNEINSVASNLKFHNLYSINFNENSIDINTKTFTNKDTIEYIYFYIIVMIIIVYINYKRYFR